MNDNIPELVSPSPQHYTIDTAIAAVDFGNAGGAVTSCGVVPPLVGGLQLATIADPATCQLTGIPTTLQEDAITYTITATNSGGDSSADISITVNDNIPALATPSPRIYTINTPIAAVNFSNTGGAVTSCEVGGDNSAAWPDGLTLKKTPDGASCQITGTPTALQEEPITYTITATNSGGTSRAAISITVNDNIPALATPSPQHYTIDTAIAAVDFGNAGGAVTSCGVVPPLVGGLQLATIADPATCQLTGIPTTLQEEPITYTITATNSGGTSSAAISITVNDNIPELVNPSPRIYTINTPIAAVNFSNLGGDVTSCGVVPPLVGGLQLATIADPATCQLTGIPTTLQEEPITYTITATNSGGTSRADISITVNDNIPELVNPNPRIYTINTAIAAVDFGNTGGAVTSCGVVPPLVGGLQLATIADPATCQLTGTPTVLQEEPITYTITATNSGGTSNAAITITVNDNIPELVSPSPQHYTIDTAIAAVDFGNTGGAVTSCGVVPPLVGGLQLATIADPATCQLTGIPTTLQEDAITYTITATNSGGTSSADISITVNDNIPELASPSPQHYTIDTAIAAVDFGNTGGAVTSCEVGGDNSAAWPDGLTLKKTPDGASCQITGIPITLHEEEATYTITATNSGGASSADISITVNDNIPELATPSPRIYTINTPIAAVDFGNAGGAVTSCGVVPPLVGGLQLATIADPATCQLTGTPTVLQEEPITYTITATNSGGTSSADISITVNDNIPALATPSPRIYTINTAIAAVDFGNAGGAVTSCDVSAPLPNGLQLATIADPATCQLTGIPTTLQEDAITYTITATNSGGTSSADISITVNDNIPALATPSPRIYTINTPIAAVDFGNTGGAVTSCDVSAPLPSGLQLATIADPATCQLTGTPTVLQEDPITYTITATNSGGTSRAAISITVNDNIPALVNPSPRIYTINTPIAAVDFGNTGGAVTSCDVSAPLPSGLQLATIADPATCQLTGIPTTLQVATTYTVTGFNSGGTSSAAISITVNDNIPELVNPSPRIYTINTPIAAVDFGNAGGAVTSCDVSAPLPNGLQLATIADPATCQLTGTPTVLQEEPITYTITATNSGGTSSAAISITVNDNIPELVNPSPRIYTINTPIAAVDFGNTGGAVTSCGVVPPLVGGLQLATIADPATCQLTGIPTTLQEEPITYTITATNSGGTSRAAISITVNDNIPALVNPSPRIYTINTPIAAVDFGNTGGAVTSCGVVPPLIGGLQLATIADPATCQLTGIPTTLQEDAITYTITATNSGGTSSADISITVNDNIPALATPSPRIYTINTPIAAVDFGNTGGAVTSCDVSAPLPSGLQLATIADPATCQLTGIPTTLQEDAITYTIIATNSGGTSSADISITVNDNIPALVNPSPRIYTINTAIAAVDFGNTGGAVTSCDVAPQLVGGLQLATIADPATCQLTGIPTTLQEEPITYTITATNSGGTSSADISITVNDNIPELVNPSPRIYTINTAIAAVDFGNTGGAVTSCGVSAPLPSDLQLATIADPATCQLTGTPTVLQEEPITYTITATNSGGTSSADISITVNDNIPALATPSPRIYTINTPIAAVDFGNAGGAVTSCGVSAPLPSDLQLATVADPATCQLTGTPTVLQEEPITYTITATNSGGTSSADISITVNDNIPALATPSPRIYTINTPIAAVDFGNTGGAVTSCGVVPPLVGGLQLATLADPATCQLTGIPTVLQEDGITYTITATNSGGTSSADISITVNDNIPALVNPSPRIYTINTPIAAVDFGNTGGAVTSCDVSTPLPSGLQLATIADPATCQLTGTPTVLQEEPITYTITATNSGGDSSADISITVNDNIPALATPSPRIYTINTPIAAVDFGNAGGAVTSCEVGGDNSAAWPDGLTLKKTTDGASCQLTGTPTALQEEPITYTITASNSGGTSSADISITVNDNIPELATPSPRIYTINTAIAAVDFGNAGGAVTSCGVVPPLVGGLQLATIADPATCQLTGTPTVLQEEPITYTITATNSGGASSAAISITVNDNIPALATPSPRIYTINTAIAAVDFGNAGGAVTSCDVAPQLIGGLQLAVATIVDDTATCQLTGMPTALQEEPITYTITATNSGGTSSADISITVNDNIPELATPSPRIYTINTPIAAVDFGNTGGAVTSCEVGGDNSAAWPDGLTLKKTPDGASCQITGTPTALHEEEATYTITATNSGGDSSADISITVNDNIPALVNPSPRIYTINTPIAAVDFGNAGGAVTSCGVVPPLVGGLQLATIADPATCQLTGTPTVLQEEPITYTITATNSGGTSSAAISITVNDNIPALATPNPRIYTINTPIAAVDFGNAGGAVTSCGVVPPLVGGLQLATIADPATCQLTGIPTTLQEDAITYTITATNSGGTSSAAISITVNDNIPALVNPNPLIYTINTPIAAVDFGNTGGAVTSCDVSAPLPSGLQLATIADPATCQLTGTPTVLQEEPITYTITATNSGGTSSADISITVNDNIPALVNPSPRIYTINTAIAAVDFGNTGGAVTSCNVSAPLPSGLQLATIADPATCQLTGIPTTLQEDAITYTITATNSGGTSSADISITVNDNIPELATPSPRIYTINTPIAAVDFGNTGGAVTSCEVGGDNSAAWPDGLTLKKTPDGASCQITGTPTALHEEEATYTITASNSGGDSSADISITVNDNIPELATPSPRIYTINTAIAAVDFGNAGGAVTSCGVVPPLVGGLQLATIAGTATCQLTGMPTALQVATTYTVTGFNSGGASSADISITVNDNIPELATPSPRIYTINTAIAAVDFGNTGGAVTSCGVVPPLVGGLQLATIADPATCQLTGIPTTLQEDPITYTITATNSGGDSSADISITVNDNIPELVNPSPRIYTINTAIAAVDFGNTGGAVTSCGVAPPLVGGLQLATIADPATCQLTGIPTALQEEPITYTITATNSGGTSRAAISITVNDNIPELVNPNPRIYTINTPIAAVDFGNTGGAVTSCDVSAPLPSGLQLATIADPATCQLTGTPTVLQEDPITYTITATNSGGTSNADISITVNDNIPALATPSPRIYTINTPIAAVDFGNTGGAVTSCGVVPPLVGGLQLATIADPATCQLTGIPTTLQEDPITYTITASNSGGTSNADISITVNDNIPALATPSPRIYTINTPIAAVDFGNTGGAVTSCDVSTPLPSGLQLATIADPATCQLTGIPTTLQEDAITYTITATNSGGTSSAAISITVNDNIPELVSPSPQSFTINTVIPTVDFGNTGGAVTSCGVVPPLVGGLQLATIADPATCQLTGTPTVLQEEPITYTITATNSGGTSSADISITVNDNIPALVNPSPRIYTINTPIAAVDFGNAGGAVTSCDVSAPLPNGLQLATIADPATCQLTGTPTVLQEEPITYTITATNSGGTSSADISITVNDNIPALATPSPRIYTINTPIAAVDFGNTGGAVTSCGVVPPLVGGLQLATIADPATCQLTGIPTALQEEPITYTITATNSGGTSSADISITVNDNIPELATPSPRIYTINTAIAAVNFGNTGGAVTSCGVAPPLVGGLQLATIADPATCQLTGTPTVLQEDPITHTITATNSGGTSSADISITVNDNIPALVNPSPRIYTINTPIAAVDFGNTGGAVTSCDVAPQLIGGLQLATIADPATCQLTGMPTALQEEPITYTITATNSGGTSSADISITVNDNIPALVNPSPRIYTINTAIAAVDFGNAGGAVTSCGVVPPLVGGLQLATIADPATCQLTGTPTVLQEEPITYTITATNSGGTSNAAITITVNDNIPELVNPSPRIYTINTPIAAVDFGNTGGAVTSCGVVPPLVGGLQLATIADPATCQLTGIPTTLQEDAITYTITASNSGGTSSADISITVNDNIPELVNPSPRIYTINTPIAAVDFGNTGGAVTSCGVVPPLVGGLQLATIADPATCQLTGMPTALQEDAITYTITATNSGGTSSADISITVNDNIPELVSPSPQSFTINTVIPTVDFGNTGGAVTSCGVVPPLVGGLQLATIADPATCQLTGIPTTLQEDPITYTITATNSGGTSSADISITVNDNIPALVNPSPRIYTINTPIAAVDFGNAGGAVTSCDVSAPLPNGLQLATIADPATCQLTGTPTALQEEPITYTITATNSGGTSRAAISITVNDNIPALVNPNPRIYTINTPIAAVDFGNTGGAVTSCDVSAPLPSGLQLATIADPATCQLTGTPTVLQEDPITYTITATNSGGTSSADISITVNDNIPALVSPSPQHYTIDTAIPTVNFSNTGGAVTSCEVGGDNSAAWPDGLTLKKTTDGASCQITGTPTALHEEEATYTITASNSGGADSAAISITVNDAQPNLISPPPQLFTINTAIPTVNFVNFGGDVTSCDVSPQLLVSLDIVLGAIFGKATCQITGTPTALQADPTTHTITASNSGGTSSADISITVNDNIPELATPSPRIYTINTPIAAVDFGNTGGAVTSCGVVPPLVGGLQLATIADPATCQLTGTPTVLQEEPITYTITATNSGGTSNADISITVNDNIPALATPSPRIYTINTPIAAVDFGNTGGAVTSCGVVPPLVGGLQLATIADPATCQLTGIPTTLQEDAITYTITATNSGGTSSADISITVNDNIPELVNPSPRIYTINTADSSC